MYRPRNSNMMHSSLHSRVETQPLYLRRLAAGSLGIAAPGPRLAVALAARLQDAALGAAGVPLAEASLAFGCGL